MKDNPNPPNCEYENKKPETREMFLILRRGYERNITEYESILRTKKYAPEIYPHLREEVERSKRKLKELDTMEEMGLI